MDFRQIRFGSEEYRQACALRQAVLREPLGLSLADEDLSAEADQLHFGLFAADGTLAACVIAAPLDPGHAKIRQMAVRPDFQGQGLGRRLLTAVGQVLEDQGFRRLSLHARAHVIGFYESLGFTVIGEPFTEVGIPHRKMTKQIGAGTAAPH